MDIRRAADLERLLKPLSVGARQPNMRYWRAVFNLGEKRGFVPRGANPINAMHVFDWIVGLHQSCPNPAAGLNLGRVLFD
jgi:hypothetical protein